jgi:hypothetical protein
VLAPKCWNGMIFGGPTVARTTGENLTGGGSLASREPTSA